MTKDTSSPADKRSSEEDYFEKQNKAALDRVRGRTKRPSPITGEAMRQEVFMGVVIDRCPTSGGIWLDSGELEQILRKAKDETEEEGFLTNFFKHFMSGEEK